MATKTHMLAASLGAHLAAGSDEPEQEIEYNDGGNDQVEATWFIVHTPLGLYRIDVAEVAA